MFPVSTVMNISVLRVSTLQLSVSKETVQSYWPAIQVRTSQEHHFIKLNNCFFRYFKISKQIVSRPVNSKLRIKCSSGISRTKSGKCCGVLWEVNIFFCVLRRWLLCIGFHTYLISNHSFKWITGQGKYWKKIVD